MLKSTDEKKPAECGFLMGDELVIGEPWSKDLSGPATIDGGPYISDEMRDAGWMVLYGLPGVDCATSLAEAVYTAMAAARPLALLQAENACLEAQSGPADASSTP